VPRHKRTTGAGEKQMKILKRIYIKAAKEAGFTEVDLPDFWYIVLRRWLEQKRQEKQDKADKEFKEPMGLPSYYYAQRDFAHELLEELKSGEVKKD
jgi:hypothetical protein